MARTVKTPAAVSPIAAAIIAGETTATAAILDIVAPKTKRVRKVSQADAAAMLAGGDEPAMVDLATKLDTQAEVVDLAAYDASTGGASQRRRTTKTAKKAAKAKAAVKAASISRSPEARKARRVIRTYLAVATFATAEDIPKAERAPYIARLAKLEPSYTKALATQTRK